MKKKTIGILLIIFLVMLISISAISAADTNGTLPEGVSDTSIATTTFEQGDNATSLGSETGNDVETNVNDNHETSNQNREVLSATNMDLLGANPNFYYNGKWYGDLDDAVDDACDNGGGTIRITARAWGYDSAEREITISDGVWITFEPYNPGDTVIFDGQGNKYWFFKIDDANAHVTFRNITFRNGGDGSLANEGGAIRVIHGSLTLYNCIFDNNKACENLAGGYGWGGAIFLDESDASLIANNCRFTNNKADNGGGAVCAEDGASATFNNCYFEGNTADDGNDVLDKDGGSHTFDNCRFIGSGSLDIDVEITTNTVHITPDVTDDVNCAVLYKNGREYDRKPCNNHYTVTFSNLEKGTYTVYMMKNEEAKYEYPGNTFSLINPSFVLDGVQVFENLSAAVNAIPSGGSGVITVEGGVYTDSANFYVEIEGKTVTIMPKDYSPLNPVIFSPNSQKNYLLYVGPNSQLTMEHITMTGDMSNALLIYTDQVCTISNCEFKNIRVFGSSPGGPIYAVNANLVLNDNTFESNGRMYLKNTVVNIDDCTFTSNSYGGQGGAIYADSSSNVTVTNSEFKFNEAINTAEVGNNAKGGAIYATKLKVDNTKFIGNGAGLGAAIYIAGNSNDPVNITNCVFDSNVATEGYRHIYSESATRIFNLEFNEYDVNIKIDAKDGSYGEDYILEGDFDWGCNLDNNYTFFTGTIDDGDVVGDLVNIEDSRFKINTGVLSGGTHEFAIIGMFTQEDSNDYFYTHRYHSDLYGNQFYIDKDAYAKILIDKAKITLTLDVKDVLIPETPVLNVEANWDLNYTIFIGNKYYQMEVKNGKASMPLTGLDLGNYTVMGMRDSDENFYLAMNYTNFSISKTYSNFLVLSTNVEYDTLAEAVANSNSEDTIYVKNGTYADKGIVISNKTLDIIALGSVVFDARGSDANFITVKKNAEVYLEGITFRGLQNRNTNYGAIVNYGYLTVHLCNFTDNKITKTSFAENGGAAIFNDGLSLEIDNCTFINNVAPLKVSTAAVTSLSYEDVSIISSIFINNSAREGGALYFKNITQFEAAIVSCEFEHNIATKGSAIYVGRNSKYLAVSSSNFIKNDIENNLGETTGLEGGVIYVNANTSEVILDVELSNFENNSNRNVDGGVICLDGISKANIGNCVFNNNSGKAGSVILIKNPYDKKLTLVIDESNFINNHATTGAIETSPRVTTLIDECLFVNNTGENRHIHNNGFTVVHDSIFEVKDAKLNALSVKYGESSIISGTADIGTNLYAVANLTVANENALAEINNNSFTYKTGILDHGKYYAVLNSIVDANNNTYVADSITEIFRVNNIEVELNISVDNITYGETLRVIESLSPNATGTINYQLNGKFYTKEEIEALKLDAGKYTLVAIYDHENFVLTSSIVNFEVYKANPTISVADVEVEYGENITINIETNDPSIYIIEIEDYKLAAFVNGSRSVEINKTFSPGTYTIKVTAQERVNYISNFTEAILKVNKNLPVFTLSVSNNVAGSDDAIIMVSAPDNAVGNIQYTVSDSNKNIVYTKTQSCREDLIISDLDDGTYEINGVFEGDDLYYSTDNIQMTSLSICKSAINVNNNNVGEESGEGNFIYQYDEDSDYEYFDTLEDAIDEVMLNGAGIIIVRGGTYSGYGFCGFDLEGELEVTIKAYEGEEVIFDCENANYFLRLTYGTEIEWTETVPPVPYEEQTEGPTVTLDRITVINGYNSEGGAIEMDAGTLTLANCTFSNNNADYGGVIYIGSTLAEYDATVIGLNTTFTNNYASDEGGVVYIVAGLSQDVSASFLLCTFLDNYQGENENRVMNYFAGADAKDITSNSCIFNGNGTVYSLKIDKINQTVTVNGTSRDVFDSVVLLYFNQMPLYKISNNGSRDFYITFEDVIAGNYTLGVMNDHNLNTYIFDNTFEMKVPNFIISDDEVYENLTDAINAVVENGIIYANENYYIEENMEMDIRKSFTLKNFRNREVVFDGNSSKWFFTIAEGYTVVFDGIYFTDGAVKNYATIENYGTLRINNCSFDSFETSEIIHNFNLMNILNSTFSLNSVNNALVWNDKDLLIDAVEFSNNIVNINSAVYNNGVADIISSNFTSNINGGNGGAIYNTNSLYINDTVFNENEGVNGGAIYNTGILQVLNSTFEDNNANEYGGAIFNENEANIFNSTFTGGFSNKDGGAIYNNYTMVINNSTFVSNSANGKGGAIYNNGSLVLTESFFGVNYADEFANIYNAGNNIQFSKNTFDFYDVILVVPDGQYGINTTITGTLNPEFNMDIQVILPGFVNNTDATVTISDGVFEYVTEILPKGVYDVKLYEIIYDVYGNIYYGQLITDRLIVNKAKVYINLTVEDVILPGAPVLTIDASKDGLVCVLFNNKLSNVTITGGHATLTLDTVDEGNYSVMVVREGDENYDDAVNTTTFKVSEYEGKFIVNSTGKQFETLRDAIGNSSSDDIIYVREGNYSAADNFGLTISNKKLTIISLGDVVFNGNLTHLKFFTVESSSDVTLCDVVITGFNENTYGPVINNKGNLTLDGCIFVNNTLELKDDVNALIYSGGNLTIVGSEFYDNILYDSYILCGYGSSVIVNESAFENNSIYHKDFIVISAKSAKIISNTFSENRVISSVYCMIEVYRSQNVLISSAFYNNTLNAEIICAARNTNLLVDNSIFSGNNAAQTIISDHNTQSTISECRFTENIVENVVLSKGDKIFSVLESTFSDNTLSGQGALNIASEMNATVNGSVFTNNRANKYRNIYSVCDVNISNSVFDALNVGYTVQDIDYGQTETIEGTIDIGTNLNFTVNLDINYRSYSVNVTDSRFTYNSGILNGGDYNVVLNPKGNNSNTYLFNKITELFTVNRIDPGLNVSVADITQGEKLKVNLTINKNISANVVFELNGKGYTKNQIENLTLNHGNYLIIATYKGDKNFLPTNAWVNFEVYKITPNITVNDVVVNYGDEIKVNVSVDVADYYTVFIGNESVSLYVNNSEIFTFASEDFEPSKYEIKVYVFETDDYNEAWGYANLTVNKAAGVFNLSSDLITYGENATIVVDVPVNAYGNITYEVYDENSKLVYNITQSCLEELIVPNLIVGSYIVTGTFEGDSYYTNSSIINSGVIVVNTIDVDLNVSASDINYGENATVIVTLPSDATGNVTVEGINGSVENGQAVIVIPGLAVGNHTFDVLYSGDDKYSPAMSNVTIFVKCNATISAIADPINYGENATVIVTLPSDATGSVVVDGINESVKNGQAVIVIPGLAVGNHTFDVLYSGDNKYSPAMSNVTVVVNKLNATIDAVADPIFDGENATVIVILPVDATGNVTVNGVTESIMNGFSIIVIPGLAVGNHTFDVLYSGDGKYNPAKTNVTIVVNENKGCIIDAPDLTKYYGAPDRFVVTVKDYYGKPIANQTVIIIVNNVAYTRVTNESGVAGMNINLAPGEYLTAVISNTTIVTSKITILSTINGSDITKIFKNGTQYYATFLDTDGNYLPDGTTVNFNINGVFYERKVSGNQGLVRLNINLDPGKYILTAINPVSGEMASNTVTVLSQISENKDLVKYFRNDSQYRVKILDKQGKAVGANETVTFNINGMIYQRLTDAEGYAQLKINLDPTDYVITTMYGDSMASNNIKVLPIITASDLVKKQGDLEPFKATIVDGQGNPAAGQIVTFNINGVLYNRTSDNAGVARLNINLGVGKYTITSMYNGESIGNTVTIVGKK